MQVEPLSISISKVMLKPIIFMVKTHFTII